jgi:hypothetical protein
MIIFISGNLSMATVDLIVTMGKAFLGFWKMPVVVNAFRWLVFSVLFGLIPFASAFFHLLITGQPAPLPGTLPGLVAHGELFIISAALAADALGDLIASGKEWAIFKVFAGGGCVLALGLASLMFADVSFNASSKPDVVYNASLWIFFTTLVSSGACKVLAEG